MGTQKLVVTQYTDPICIWCYELDAPLRRLEWELGDAVEYHTVLGLLVDDVRKMIGNNPLSNIVFAKLRGQVRREFTKAAERGGIPISTNYLDTITPEDASSRPSSTAIEAMKLIDEAEGDRYLRRVREAFHSDELNASRDDVLLELARAFPVDQEQFAQNLRDGSARAALERDVARARERGIRSFPVLELTYGERQALIRGYVGYDELARKVAEVTGGELTPRQRPFSLEAVAEFVATYGRVASGELACAFSLDARQLEETAGQLVASGAFSRQDLGGGFFLTASAGTCDPLTGVCSL